MSCTFDVNAITKEKKVGQILMVIRNSFQTFQFVIQQSLFSHCSSWIFCNFSKEPHATCRRRKYFGTIEFPEDIFCFHNYHWHAKVTKPFQRNICILLLNSFRLWKVVVHTAIGEIAWTERVAYKCPTEINSRRSYFHRLLLVNFRSNRWSSHINLRIGFYVLRSLSNVSGTHTSSILSPFLMPARSAEPFSRIADTCCSGA